MTHLDGKGQNDYEPAPLQNVGVSETADTSRWGNYVS